MYDMIWTCDANHHSFTSLWFCNLSICLRSNINVCECQEMGSCECALHIQTHQKFLNLMQTNMKPKFSAH